MEILAFLVVLGNVILLAWGFRFFRSSALKQKSRSRSQPQSQLPPKSQEPPARATTISKPSLPKAQVQNKTISNSSRKTTPGQPLVFKKFQTRSTRDKHQWNIQHGDRSRTSPTPQQGDSS